MSIKGKDLVVEEILAFLEQEQENADNGFTSKDLERKWGHGERKLSNAIDRMIEDGLIEPARLVRKNRVGILTKVYGYRLTDRAHERAAAQSDGILDQTS